MPEPSAAASTEGVSNYGIARDFPLLWERTKLHDARERLGGGDRDPVNDEIDEAMRELWNARRFASEKGETWMEVESDA